jgi:ParB family chromosome partitioning protein
MNTKDKYHNIDTLLQSSESDKELEATGVRRKRPSPAIGTMMGGNKPTRTLDVLRAEKEAAEAALKDAKNQFDKEKAELENQLQSINAEDQQTVQVMLTMPVTKQRVAFKLTNIDPALIDVSPENERIQDFLDSVALQDIIPSIKKHGQQKPGTVRPKHNGRFELIEGSRRLAAVKLVGKQYLALVGDVPDADVRELSVIENKHQDVSYYEKAKAYQRRIDRGEYANWTQLGASEGISSSHINRYKLCADLDEIFVRILPSPSDMPLSYGEMIAGYLKKDEKQVFKKARDILEQRQLANQSGVELPGFEEIVSFLKSAVRIKPAIPTLNRPIIYKSHDKTMTLKHSITSTGSTKFELAGVPQDKIDKIRHYLINELQVEKRKSKQDRVG